MLNYSSPDSNRFAMNIFRSTPENLDLEQLRMEIEDSKADIVVLRLLSDTKKDHSALLKLPWPVIHCDNLVYYQCSLSASIAELRNDLRFEEINAGNVLELDSLIPIVFKDYQNHYFSNPVFPEEDIVKGYLEWAKSYVTENQGRISWLVFKNDELAAFATCSFNIETKACEGILYGVHPDFAGKGLYSDLIRFTQSYFKNLGYQRMLVSTQIQNYSVQKVWGRENFTLKNAYDTYHINSFLSNPDRVQNSI